MGFSVTSWFGLSSLFTGCGQRSISGPSGGIWSQLSTIELWDAGQVPEWLCAQPLDATCRRAGGNLLLDMCLAHVTGFTREATQNPDLPPRIIQENLHPSPSCPVSH